MTASSSVEQHDGGPQGSPPPSIGPPRAANTHSFEHELVEMAAEKVRLLLVVLVLVVAVVLLLLLRLVKLLLLLLSCALQARVELSGELAPSEHLGALTNNRYKQRCLIT